MDISKTIQKLMRLHGDNPNKLAKMIGVSQPTIYRLASGKSQHTSAKTIAAVAKHYKVELVAMLEGRIVNLGEAPTLCKKCVVDELLAQLPVEEAGLWLAKIGLAVAEHKVALKNATSTI